MGRTGFEPVTSSVSGKSRVSVIVGLSPDGASVLGQMQASALIEDAAGADWPQSASLHRELRRLGGRVMAPVHPGVVYGGCWLISCTIVGIRRQLG